MILQYTKLITILLLVFIVWCNEAVANPTFDGYHYEKPSIPFDYPTAIKMMPKTVVTKPTPTKEESVKVETKPKQTVVLIETKQNEKTIEQQTLQSTDIRTTINNKDLNGDANKTVKPITLITTKTEHYLKKNLNSNRIITNNSHDQNHHNHKRLKPGHSLDENKHTNFKPYHDIKAESSDQIQQQYVYNKPQQTDELEKFLNRDNEFIYRLSTNVGKHPIVTHNESSDENNHRHGAVKRLKLKHGFLGNLHSNNTQACCEQNLETLKLKFSERSHNRPLERRLTPYTETIIDKEYFE